MEYDANIVEEYSDRLYSKAKRITLRYTVFCTFLGLIGGAVVGIAAQKSGVDITRTSAAIGAIVFGIVGYMAGEEKGFQLKLLAQSALCQVRIEKNTRHGGMLNSPG